MSKTGDRQSYEEDYYQLFVLGAASVGKSAIIHQFIHGSIADTVHIPICTDEYPKDCVIDDVPTTLKIFNHHGGGQELDSCLRLLRQCMNIGDGFLLIFSVNDYSSFEQIYKYHELIRTLKDRKLPILMVGNEAELYCQRRVPIKKAQNLARKLEIPYIECSAALRMNVEEAFYELVRTVRKFRRRSKRSSLKKSIMKCFML